MKKRNKFGLPYFQWHHGFIFNEGGSYFTFQLQWLPHLRRPSDLPDYTKPRFIILRIWISLIKILGREFEFTFRSRGF